MAVSRPHPRGVPTPSRPAPQQRPCGQRSHAPAGPFCQQPLNQSKPWLVDNCSGDPDHTPRPGRLYRLHKPEAVMMYDVNEHGELRPSNRQLMGRLVLAEVVLLFLALLIATAFLGDGFPRQMPRTADIAFLLSTGLMIASTASLLLARQQQRHPGRGFRRWMLVNWSLGTLFLISQAVGFGALFQALSTGAALGGNLQMLYVVAGVHAVHVLGGMVMLTRVTRRAFVRRYDPGLNPAFRLLEPYWHLLSIIWLLFYLIL